MMPLDSIAIAAICRDRHLDETNRKLCPNILAETEGGSVQKRGDGHFVGSVNVRMWGHMESRKKGGRQFFWQAVPDTLLNVLDVT